MTFNSKVFTYKECKAEVLFLSQGIYELEVFGASGGTRGSSNTFGGSGGYSRGILTLKKKTKVFVHVGSQGNDTTNGQNSAGCNGGGYAIDANGRSGGGATDIRLNEDSLYSRVIVAGGGGGTGDTAGEYGGFGGGETGGDGGNEAYRAGKGANQTSPGTTCADGSNTNCPSGSFGYGGNATRPFAGGAGGGWFGGSASYYEKGGGGGSGYVFTSSSIKPDNFLLTSEYYLKNTLMLSGEETNHTGNGLAIIKRLSNSLFRGTCFCRKRNTYTDGFLFMYRDNK